MNLMKFNLAILFCLLFCSVHGQQRLAWNFNLGSGSHDRAYDIAQDASGNLYVTGYFQGTGLFNPQAGQTTNLVSEGGTDIFIAKYNTTRDLLWAVSIGGASDDEGLALDVDASGNVYVTGSFQGTADFDFGAGTNSLSSNGGKDAFLVKYDTDGVHQWAFNIGESSDDIGYDVAVDGSNDIYITGSFQGSDVNFNPGGSELNTSVGVQDIFLAKYASDMSFVWASAYGNTSLDEGVCLTTDKLNNVYMSGRFANAAGTGIDFGGGALTPTFGTIATFVAKYSSANVYQDAFIITGTVAGVPPNTNTVIPAAMAIDDNNNELYITGTFFATDADFDPSGSSANLSSVANYDIFVAKYTTAFVYDWAFNIGSSVTNGGVDIALDANNPPNVFVTGWFQGTTDFDPDAGTNSLSAVGSQDIFVAKYDDTGAHQEAFSVGSTADDSGFGITIGSAGDIFCTGYFNGTNIDFDPATNATATTTNGSDDIYLVRYYTAEQALPVELIDFRGELTTSGTSLSWETASEKNNSHFDVEWSTNGETFKKIGLIEGAGTTIENQSYSFLHENSVQGENYYRLKQVDYDGQYEYTPVIMIDIQGVLSNNPKIYPNPATDYLFVDVNEKTNCQIIDVTGKIIKEYQLTKGTSIDISELSSGTYLIKIGEKTQKFIVE